MKLVIFNGSPRVKKSNSKLLIEAFIKGFHSYNKTKIEVHYIGKQRSKTSTIEAYNSADIALIVFPLYTDCMPGIVKDFFETIAQQKNTKDKTLGFIVQSGFPESIHSIYVARYLEKLCQRLDYHYLGTAIKGGVEGLRIMPSWMQKKTLKQFENLGKQFAKNSEFDSKILARMSTPYRMPKYRLIMFKLFQKMGMSELYWDSNLKKNQAFDKRFDQPYNIIYTER